MGAYSDRIGRYFQEMEDGVVRAYSIAEEARGKHLDPAGEVEIPRAIDLAMRVEKLLVQQGYPVDGVAEDIRKLTAEIGNREKVALEIAKREAGKLLKKGIGTEKAIDTAVRLGLAVLTEGILVAPLEGIIDVKVGKNGDGSDYVSIFFAGPIRSAGGTGQAMSVLIADVVRRELGIDRYKPTDDEVERYKEEIPLYERSQHLQYKPSSEEVDLIVRNCPICIDGEGTEKVEVSGHRDLPRVDGNRVRGGACLVIAEGMCLKASKLKKHVDALNMDGWDFIGEYVERFGKGKKKGDKKVGPNYKFIKDVLAGRPVFSGPSAVGGFRLRYGRARTTGVAATALNPVSLYILDEFPALGTQIKIERPGKAGVVTPCDTIEGPSVVLVNGDFIRVKSVEEAKKLRESIKRIPDVGEILVAYGEFLENNHPLMPASFSIEWWELEAKEKTGKIPEGHMDWDSEKAFTFSKENGVPLHPNFNFFWHDIGKDDVIRLREYLKSGEMDGEKITVPADDGVKEILIRLGAHHLVRKGKFIIEKGKALYMSLNPGNGDVPDGERTVDIVSELSGVKIMERAPTRIGARMGRPEKAKERKMDPPVHSLFPIGNAGGNQRLLKDAARNGRRIRVELGKRKCPSCGFELSFPRAYCPKCGAPTVFQDRVESTEVDLSSILESALSNLGESMHQVKAVKGMMSGEKMPEPLEKGILRAKHEVYVFKDGTCRFDMTDVPLTHFRPREIGLSVEKARELGYTRDWEGKPLESEEQLLEIFPQDIIPSRGAGRYMVRVAGFIDDELEKFYGMERFYNARDENDLIGHLVVGLAPHTSGGVLARIIGYTETHMGLAHPYFHTAKRRNCDGDEDSIMLLMDGLLNFSRKFLPSTRGGLMDAPLVLTTKIVPDEIDKEAHNVDLMKRYPLEFYRKTLEYADPKEVSDIMDTVKDRIGTPAQYEGLYFTHDTQDISLGPVVSNYTRIGDMKKKIEAQMRLARILDAVDERDVTERMISTHFLPDMIGNLRAFATQSFRCTKCGKKYRRPPLSGKCECGNELILTVHKKSVRKYTDITRELARKYDVSPYMAQRIDILVRNMESMFDNEKMKAKTLDEFF